MERTDPKIADQLAWLAVRYRPAVSAFFARRIPERADVDDLTQEVFARLAGRSQSGAIDNLEGYIFQIAANLLRERFRRAGRRNALAATVETQSWVDQDEDFSPERILLARETYASLVQALRELPERVRTVLILNRFEGLSGKEIARRLGVSTSTVEKDMMRALAHLRDRVT